VLASASRSLLSVGPDPSHLRKGATELMNDLSALMS
jgi:hypothetical protein